MPQIAGVRHRFIALRTGVEAHVAEAGPDHAPAVLALHGWPQHWYAWRKVIPLLDSVRFIAPDLRGLGWSGWPEDGAFRKARMAEDAVALLDALGIERALLLGHDWGGWIGFLAALRWPERWSGLVAVAIPHPRQPRTRAPRHEHRLAPHPGGAPPPRQMPRRGSRALRVMGGDENAVFVATYRDPRRAEAAGRL